LKYFYLWPKAFLNIARGNAPGPENDINLWPTAIFNRNAFGLSMAVGQNDVFNSFTRGDAPGYGKYGLWPKILVSLPCRYGCFPTWVDGLANWANGSVTAPG